jgi:hypothetical protein
MDMHGWGFLLGVVPNLAIAAGLVAARAAVSEGRRGSARAIAVVIGALVASALVASALLDLRFRALGPPFSLFVLAPATIALAALGRDRGLRRAWVVLATAYVTAIGLALVPLETSDSFGGYRIYGLVAHVASGWAWMRLAWRTRSG